MTLDVDALAAVVGATSVDGARRLSGGASRETWSVDATFADGRVRGLIVHRDRAGAASAGPRPPEGALLRAAAAAGVPVPEVVGEGPGLLVTARVDGETIPRRILRDEEFATARPLVVAQTGRALGALHTIDPAAVPELVGGDQIAQWRAILDATGEPHPAFELGFRWLEANRPAPRDAVVVHGDFRVGNLLIGPDGLRAVLDWELAHLGDPHEDLGWLCVRAWRFGEDHQRVGGLGDLDDLLDAYASVAGWRPDPAAVRWWEVLGTLKWGVMCILQAATHLNRLSRSVELAAIGRRVCENEWDVLTLIAPDPPTTTVLEALTRQDAGSVPREWSGTGLHGRPTASELVEAVREYLENDVMGATEGRVRFHARVAVNALAMIERELVLADEQAAAQRARLAALGVGDEGGLVTAIQQGDLDDRLDEVFAAVAADVRARVAVAHPGYDEPR